MKVFCRGTAGKSIASDRAHAGCPPRKIACGGVCWLVLLALAVQGCGGSGSAGTLKVQGVVKYNGKALPNGTVMFNPEDPKTGHVAQGKVDKDGSFVLSTYQTGDGILPGKYHVTVTSTVPGSEPLPKDKGTGVGGKSAIPERYGNPKTSALDQTIGKSDSGKTITLELKE